MISNETSTNRTLANALPPGATAVGLYDRFGVDCYRMALRFAGRRRDAELIVEAVFADRIDHPEFWARADRIGIGNALIAETHREYCDHFAWARD